jgi:hypothetical protein
VSSQDAQHQRRGNDDERTEFVTVPGVFQKLDEVLCKVFGRVMPKVRGRRVCEAMSVGSMVPTESIGVDLMSVHRPRWIDAVIELADVVQSRPFCCEEPSGRSVGDEDPDDRNPAGGVAVAHDVSSEDGLAGS